MQSLASDCSRVRKADKAASANDTTKPDGIRAWIFHGPRHDRIIWLTKSWLTCLLDSFPGEEMRNIPVTFEELLLRRSDNADILG